MRKLADSTPTIDPGSPAQAGLLIRCRQAAARAVGLVRNGRPDLVLAVLLYRAWWRMRGLDFGTVPIEEMKLDPRRAYWHQNGGGPLLYDLLRQLKITPSDAVLDLGSGKGGAMATLAQFPFRTVDGVELSQELVVTARSNLARLRLSQCRVYHGDAAEFSELDPYTFVFMFSPFPELVLDEVLRNLQQSLVRHPRTVHLIYSNPEHESSIQSAGIFRRRFEYRPFDGYTIRVYANTDVTLPAGARRTRRTLTVSS